MARTLRTWAITEREKLCNFRYRPQTRLVRGMYRYVYARMLTVVCVPVYSYKHVTVYVRITCTLWFAYL